MLKLWENYGDKMLNIFFDRADTVYSSYRYAIYIIKGHPKLSTFTLQTKCYFFTLSPHQSWPTSFLFLRLANFAGGIKLSTLIVLIFD